MIINESLIKLNLNARTKEEALMELAMTAAAMGKVSNEVTYIDAVLHREAEFSTAVGYGIAIPHGKSQAVIEPFLMFARVDQLDWQAMDGNPVDLVFMIGVPKEDAGQVHLKILAALSRKLMKDDFRQALRAAETEAQLLKVLEESDLGL